jgi:hypothetical protein
MAILKSSSPLEFRRVIRGRVYDTSEATPVTFAEGYAGNDDASYWRETLYCTQSGHWFVYREGEAPFPGRERVGRNGSDYGRRIKALGAKGLARWIEERSTDPMVFIDFLGFLDTLEA